MFSLFYFSSFVVKFDLFTPVNSVHCKLLLAHLESAYSLMWVPIILGDKVGGALDTFIIS